MGDTIPERDSIKDTGEYNILKLLQEMREKSLFQRHFLEWDVSILKNIDYQNFLKEIYKNHHKKKNKLPFKFKSKKKDDHPSVDKILNVSLDNTKILMDLFKNFNEKVNEIFRRYQMNDGEESEYIKKLCMDLLDLYGNELFGMTNILSTKAKTGKISLIDALLSFIVIHHREWKRIHSMIAAEKKEKDHLLYLDKAVNFQSMKIPSLEEIKKFEKVIGDHGAGNRKMFVPAYCTLVYAQKLNLQFKTLFRLILDVYSPGEIDMKTRNMENLEEKELLCLPLGNTLCDIIQARKHLNKALKNTNKEMTMEVSEQMEMEYHLLDIIIDLLKTATTEEIYDPFILFWSEHQEKIAIAKEKCLLNRIFEIISEEDCMISHENTKNVQTLLVALELSKTYREQIRFLKS
mmetsp:Transcript_4023/g.5942  ORF Transcript_4023/g.5942 Transcript_4023/m.5942 type:complete len:405 (-) Transcript_4023:32-1246(-)